MVKLKLPPAGQEQVQLSRQIMICDNAPEGKILPRGELRLGPGREGRRLKSFIFELSPRLQQQNQKDFPENIWCIFVMICSFPVRTDRP